MRGTYFIPLVFTLSVAGVAAKEKPPASYTIPLPPRPDFAALDWLVGEWTGATTGRGPGGEIRLSVSYDLDNRFMVFREQVALPATKTAPGVTESWMGILSGDRSGTGFVLRVFSTTGFLTRYRVIVEGAEIRFDSEGGEAPPPGWVFRRLIRRTSHDEFTQTVQAAPPGKPFFDYYTAKLTRPPTP